MSCYDELAQSVSEILIKLSDRTRIVHIKAGGLVSINRAPEAECFILHKGHVYLRRTEDKLVHCSIIGPVPFGFNRFQDLTGKVYLEALTDIDIEIIPASHFYQKIALHNLWQPLLNVMMFISADLFRRNNLLFHKNDQTVITEQINNLCNEPDYLRQTINVCEYIMQRTNLSRATVLKHLSILRRNRKIELQSGLLVLPTNS